MSNLKNILNDEERLKDQDLLRYLQGELSGDELHQVEKQMADSDFVNDAVEGLQEMPNPKSIEQYLDELNAKLRKQVKARKVKRDKHRMKDQPLIVAIVAAVIVICILCYIAVQVGNNPSPSNDRPSIKEDIKNH